MTLLLLTVSIVFNYNLSKELKDSISLSETIKAALQESDMENDVLEVEISSLAEELSRINDILQIKTELIRRIDHKLEANGAILENIDVLLIESYRLADELNAAFLKLNIFEEENTQKIDDIILTEGQKEQWGKALREILNLLDGRISILEEGISSLSTFSLERIMVKQEIDFLKTLYENVEKLNKDIQDL